MSVSTKTFVPKVNITVYELNDNYSTKFYLEARDVVDGDLGPAYPLQQDTLQNIVDGLAATLSPGLSFKGPISPNVVYLSQKPQNECLIWKYTKGVANLLFSESTGIKSGIYSVPQTLFVWNKGLRIFAYKREDSLSEKTVLYQAPYYNINEQGNVCMGSANIKYRKEMSAEQLMKEVENKFWNSIFTHASAKPLVNGKVDILFARHWNAALEFWDEMLIPCKSIKTLGNLIQSLNEN